MFFKNLEMFSDGDLITHETIVLNYISIPDLCNLGNPYVLGGKALCILRFFAVFGDI